MRKVLGPSLALMLCAGGCLERRVSITSEPSGALVTANDVELGRTPVEADFTYYGEYDVRVEMAGYEPLRTVASARTPIQEYPPIDLAVAALPFDVEKVTRWHFTLVPNIEIGQEKDAMEKAVVERARALREQLGER